MRVLPGSPRTLGASWNGEAVDFALFSANATRVELCLFDGPGAIRERSRIELPERTGDVFHGRFPGIAPGQLYAYRVHGPWAPHEGHRFNPRKLLIDPYARALHGELRWHDALLGHDPADPARPNGQDSAPYVPRSVVVDPEWDWDGDASPGTPWSSTVIYECHVKGTTIRHPGVPGAVRGCYEGLASEAMIHHLRDLGVTSVELMPVSHSVAEEHLARRGATNYWGYAPVGFFAPDARFASDGAPAASVAEFRRMVRALHDAGIEVILDVVFNHTPEGGPGGPTLSLRGIDNASYYRLHRSDPAQYTDYTGTGHTLDTAHPRVRQLVIDSLCYWVQEMHVDGFRFDLAPVLARDHGEFDPFDPFFEIVRQDPVLSAVKLIAEPWDLGPEGYRLGGFPLGWSEWNDRYRDTTRRFWRGDGGLRGELASRLAGSSDVFPGDRGPVASVNYVCSHDGFTLRDLVSYSHKHNEANGEGGRDGPPEEGQGWGAEGPSRNRRVTRMRDRTRRNLAATLALSCGVPMWLGGDEIGRTQQGNNNAYCQDNEISWLDWDLDGDDKAFLDFVRHCFAVRRRNAVYRRRHHLDGASTLHASWIRADGSPM
ncbi:MAG: glycogen debranching protein GlgX, partial [Actinomycetota bacterium]|nr:glycogen debranching protein GlgX [Actinomycetota bacterium]